MKISVEIQEKLICPKTKAKLVRNGSHLESAENAAIKYPIENGTPILINEENSIFTIENYINSEKTTWATQGKTERLLRSLIPKIGTNIKAKVNYKKIATMLPSGAKILVIGGGLKGDGTDPIYCNNDFEVIGSDVFFGQFNQVISDAHDIPFQDETFDCVISQAVLEHVADPYRCASEIHRVLKADGLIYAETPFMQQVHMKQYDFTRFTHLGHRRLLRQFEEISSGPCCGPGMALAWSYCYFLRSFSNSYPLLLILGVFARTTSFFLKYLDHYLIDKPGAYDAASGLFFLGRKSSDTISDKEIISGFRGIRHNL